MNSIVEINFYGEKKPIKLPEKFELFKLGLKSLLGNEVELKYLNIFYKDDEKDKVNIDTEEEYKQLITQIKNKKFFLLFFFLIIIFLCIFFYNGYIFYQIY